MVYPIEGDLDFEVTKLRAHLEGITGRKITKKETILWLIKDNRGLKQFVNSNTNLYKKVPSIKL